MIDLPNRPTTYDKAFEGDESASLRWAVEKRTPTSTELEEAIEFGGPVTELWCRVIREHFDELLVELGLYDSFQADTGSRYYTLTTAHRVRVSDHPPNDDQRRRYHFHIVLDPTKPVRPVSWVKKHRQAIEEVLNTHQQYLEPRYSHGPAEAIPLFPDEPEPEKPPVPDGLRPLAPWQLDLARLVPTRDAA